MYLLANFSGHSLIALAAVGTGECSRQRKPVLLTGASEGGRYTHSTGPDPTEISEELRTLLEGLGTGAR